MSLDLVLMKLINIRWTKRIYHTILVLTLDVILEFKEQETFQGQAPMTKFNRMKAHTYRKFLNN
jgi:hypothetical protein